MCKDKKMCNPNAISKPDWKKIVSFLIVLVAMPICIWLGILLFQDRQYHIVSIVMVVFSLVPFFLVYENRANKVRELLVIAVMSAISIVGRLLFAPIPGFKPVTAIVMITALAFGSEAGFLTGAISALVSNMFFGQGPWTPFQMFAWGMLGFVTGLFWKRAFAKKIPILVLFGVLGGIGYSLMMDLWTVLAIDTQFSIARYLTTIALGLPMMAVYAASNVLFLIVATKPLIKKLQRIKTKYALFAQKDDMHKQENPAET